MEIVIKSFSELTNIEIYKLLQLRVEVFVVEQNCPYQDIDDEDQEAMHILLKEGDKILACSRVYQKEKGSDDVIKLGRVVSATRGLGHGYEAVKHGILAAKQFFKCKSIYIHSQCQAQGFYEKFGFVAYGEVFMEDFIPHVKMSLEIKP